MAPIPEPIPVTTAIRASAGLRSSSRAKREANPALIWPVGPSRPPEPPDPMVRADATILTMTARKRMPRGLWWTAEMAASVPCPSASGANRNTRMAPSSAPSPTTSGSAQGRENDADAAVPAFADRGWHAITGQCPEEEVSASKQCLVKHDGTNTSHCSDKYAEDQPLLQIGSVPQPTGCPCHGSSPRGSANGSQGTLIQRTRPLEVPSG